MKKRANKNKKKRIREAKIKQKEVEGEKGKKNGLRRGGPGGARPPPTANAAVGPIPICNF